MSLQVTSLLMPSLNPSLGLASFPHVTRLVLSLAHHLEGAYYSIFRIPFIISLLLLFCHCIGIFIYLNSLNNNQVSLIMLLTQAKREMNMLRNLKDPFPIHIGFVFGIFLQKAHTIGCYMCLSTISLPIPYQCGTL